MKRLLSKISLIPVLALVILLMTTFIMPYAAAQAAVDDPECWGVFVGFDEYQLLGTGFWYDDEVDEVYNEISPTWGASHTQLLKDAAATKAGIMASITWLANNADSNDTAFFYLTTLGSSAENAAWVYDTVSGTSSSFLQPTVLGNALNQISAGRIVVVLQVWGAGIFIPNLAGSNRVIITSSDVGESAWVSSTLGASNFGHYIIEAFNNFNAADANGDLELSAEEIYVYAAPLTTADHSDQHPQINDQYAGEIPLLAKFSFNSTVPTSGATLVTLDGVAYTSSISTRLWVPMCTHTLEVPDVVSAGAGTRYAFTGWSDAVVNSSRTVTHGFFTANYDKEYLLTINSPYGSPTGAGWYVSGAIASFSLTDYIETPDTKHYFTGWSGDFVGTSASGSITMHTPKTINAIWGTEYLLTINSQYGAPTGAGWYDAGLSINISIEESQGIIIRQIFDGWSGDLTSTAASATVTMDGPKVITANWHTDYMQLYIVIIVVIVVAAGIIITIVLVNRKGRTPGVPPSAAGPAGTPPPTTTSAPPTSGPPTSGPPPTAPPSTPPPPPPPSAA